MEVALEYEDWFWGVEGGSLDPEGLDVDGQGWFVRPPAPATATATATAVLAAAAAAPAGLSPAAALGATAPAAPASAKWAPAAPASAKAVVPAVAMPSRAAGSTPRPWGPVDPETLARDAAARDAAARDAAARDVAARVVAAPPELRKAEAVAVSTTRRRGLGFLGAARRTWVTLVLGLLLIAIIGAFAIFQFGPGSGSGLTNANSVVDPGADVALEEAAALRAAPPAVNTGSPPPARLIVRAIGIDAPVEAVGLDKNGNMAVPSKSTSTAWYDRGPSPGDPGDAVIDGHLDWYDTGHAVFFSLSKVKLGTDIELRLQSGVSHHFKVTGVKTVAYNAKVPGLFATSGPARLSLITCGGQWSKSLNQYVSRVIVDSTMVS